MLAAIFAFTSLTGIATAATPGAYIGLGLGASRIESPNQFLVTGTNINSSRKLGGFGGRVFGGYNFNQYVGIEAGFNQYAQSKYTSTDTINHASATLKYTMNTLDVVGKAYLPISDTGFNLYGLGGVARVNSTQKLDVSQPGLKSFHKEETTHKFRPVYGLGASYDVTPQVTTNLEFSRMQGNGSKSNVPSANMVTLGVAYNFG